MGLGSRISTEWAETALDYPICKRGPKRWEHNLRSELRSAKGPVSRFAFRSTGSGRTKSVGMSSRLLPHPWSFSRAKSLQEKGRRACPESFLDTPFLILI